MKRASTGLNQDFSGSTRCRLFLSAHNKKLLILCVHIYRYIRDIMELKNLGVPLCTFCKHLQYYKGGYYCHAFGDERIPQKILLNRRIHDKAYPGDHGIQFEPADELAARHDKLHNQTFNVGDFRDAVSDVLMEIRGGPGSGPHAGSGGGKEDAAAARTASLSEGNHSDEVHHTYDDAASAFDKYRLTASDDQRATQRQALSDWVYAWQGMNAYLRGGADFVMPGDYNTNMAYNNRDDIKEKTEIVQALVENGPQYEGTVYHGFAPSSEESFNKYAGLSVGDVCSDKGFLATTTDKSFAQNFPYELAAQAQGLTNDDGEPLKDEDGDDLLPTVPYVVQMEIHDAKGIAIDKAASTAAQKEVLMKPSTNLKVLEKTRNKGFVKLVMGVK